MTPLKGMLCLPVLLVSTLANATLSSRAGGTMIYDSEYDLTWLADANYAKSSGYDANGQMVWSEANAWAGQLEFGGFSDWRLASAINTDGSDPGSLGDDSELYHLTQLLWGNQGSGGQALSGNYSDNYSLFQNIQDTMYWSSDYSTDASNPNKAWMTTFTCCEGYLYLQQDQMASSYGWAVRSGDVAPVPVPAAFWLLGSGFFGLASYSRCRFKRLVS